MTQILVDKDIIEDCKNLVSDLELQVYGELRYQQIKELYDYFKVVLKESSDKQDCDLCPSSSEITMALAEQKQWIIDILGMLSIIHYNMSYREMRQIQQMAKDLKAKVEGEK